MKFLCLLRAVFLFFFLLVFTLISSVITLTVVSPFMSRDACDRWIRTWAKTCIKVSGTRIHVSGLENFTGLNSCIMVSNHLSHYDIPVLFSCIPVSFRMVAKMELFRIPFFGRAIRALGFVPVVRDNSEGSKKVFQEMEQKFSSGQSIWMAPEGTRFPTGTVLRGRTGIGPFKSGAFYLALRAGEPILPICIYGTQKVLGKNSLLVNWHSWTQDVFVRILPVVPVALKDPRTRKELCEEVRKRLLVEFSRIHKSSGDRDPLILAEDSRRSPPPKAQRDQQPFFVAHHADQS